MHLWQSYLLSVLAMPYSFLKVLFPMCANVSGNWSMTSDAAELYSQSRTKAAPVREAKLARSASHDRSLQSSMCWRISRSSRSSGLNVWPACPRWVNLFLIPTVVVVTDVAVAQGCGHSEFTAAGRSTASSVRNSEKSMSGTLALNLGSLRADGADPSLQHALVRLLDYGAHRLHLGLVSFEDSDHSWPTIRPSSLEPCCRNGIASRTRMPVYWPIFWDPSATTATTLPAAARTSFTATSFSPTRPRLRQPHSPERMTADCFAREECITWSG